MLPSPLVGEGRISTRGTSVRNSGEGWWLSHDTILDIDQSINVIPHLLRDLKDKIRSRNTYRLRRRMQAHTTRSSSVRFAKSGMTVVYCHPELVSGSHNCDDMKAPLPTLSPRGRGVVEPRQHIEFSCHCEGATHVDMSANIRRAAFTLAEVLITLGIIGIVAAMTIPTLIADYQEKVTITRLKEAYSMLSQAYQFAVNENGSPASWKFGTDMYDPNAHVAMANYFKPYLRLSADCVGKSLEYVKEHCTSTFSLNEEKFVAFLRLNNGATLIFRVWNPSCNGVYANSIKGDTCGQISVLTDPMKTLENGRNQFMFYLTTKGIIPAGMDGSYLEFERACNPDIELPYPGFASDSNMYACAAWVIYNNNMDYLKCPGELSWDGKHSCKD